MTENFVSQRDWFNAVLERSLEEVFARQENLLRQEIAAKEARRSGRPFAKWPEDAPFYEAEEFCREMLAWIDEVRYAIGHTETPDAQT